MSRKIIISIIGFFIIVVIAITYQSFNPLIKNLTKKYFFQSKYINQIENLNKALRLEIEEKDAIVIRNQGRLGTRKKKSTY